MGTSARERARAALKTALPARLREMRGRSLTPDGIVGPWSAASWERASDSDEIFWLGCAYSEDSLLARYWLSTQLETAVLFALLARVDLALWKEIIGELWDDNWYWIEWADFVATRTALVTGVELIVSDYDEDLVKASERTMAWLRGPRSDEYSRLRVLIAEASGLESSEFPDIPLRLTVGDENSDGIPRHLQRVCEILATQSEATAPVRLTHFTSGTSEVTVETGDIGALASLRARGVQVTDLPVARIRSGEQLTRPQCLEYVREILESTPAPVSRAQGKRPSRTRHGHLATNQPRLAGVERIALSSSLPEELVPSVFSAIRSSSSLRVVEFQLERVSRQRSSVLQWLAFAVFSREPLAQLIISNSSQLRMADVEIMRQIVMAQNPLAVLFPEEIVPDEHCVAVTSTAFLSHPRNTGNPTEWRQESPASLEIIGKARRGFVPVLLPGWGKASVSEAATSKTPSSDGHPNGRSPTQLLIQNGEKTPELLAFIRLFGTSVKQIKIYEFDDPDEPLGAFCRQVLIACPHLETLEVSRACFESLNFIVHAFEANECPALTRLTLFGIELVSTRGINAILRALSDPNTTLAIQLRKLVLLVDSVEAIEPATPERAREMLQCNSTLRDFELTFAVDMYPGVCRVDFDEFNKTELFHDAMPLSRRCVCAFLSAVTGGHDRQLDSVVIRQILGYASARRVRTVRVSFG